MQTNIKVFGVFGENDREFHPNEFSAVFRRSSLWIIVQFVLLCSLEQYTCKQN